MMQSMFHVPIGRLYVFFRELPIQTSCPLCLYEVVCSFAFELYEFFLYFEYCVLSHSCATLWRVACSFVLGIFQARILEWVAISISSPLSDRQFANDFSLWWAAVSLCCWFPLLCRSFSLWCSPICLFLCLLLCFWCQIKRSVPRLVWSSYCLWILRLCS